MAKGRGLIRSTNRKGVHSGKSEAKAPPVSRAVLRGASVLEREGEFRRRIENVAKRAGGDHPERAVVAISRAGDDLEIATSSQQLAHRIVKEMKKAFRGQASYEWSREDGSLLAIWQSES
jgi:hypothetical protein